MTLRVRLFGHLQILDNEQDLAASLRPRSRRLLAYLLLHRRTAISRESAAFSLWPDVPEKTALGSLRRALSELRAALPPPPQGDWVEASRSRLRWNPAGAWIDAEEFERLLRQATPAALHEATAICRGDLLPEFDDDWVSGERERLRAMQLDALRVLTAHHRAIGEYAAALEIARQALALEPGAETTYRDLMALHYLAGDRSAALAEYERLRALLRDELGVEPMAETQALAAAIARETPLPMEAPPERGARRAPHEDGPAPPPLVGREPELGELAALWQAAAAGHGQVVVVTGEAGVGKTRLAQSLVEGASRNGGLALVGHSYQFERALPYQALLEMLRPAASLLQRADLGVPHRAALARLAPDVIGAAGAPGTTEADTPETMRAQLFEALLQAFAALARTQPVLLLFEDAHWAAESTLDWLTYITPRLAGLRLLALITYRTDEAGTEHPVMRLAQRFAPDGLAQTVALPPLTRAAHQELVASLSGLEAKTASRVADRLFAETTGNPFYLHELVRGLIEAGQIKTGRSGWSGPFVEAPLGAPLALPGSLRASIGARLERLTEAARAFLRTAAVAGRVFHFEIVRQAGDWPEELALGALEELLGRGFVRSAEGEQAGDYAFNHHLMQEAICADLAAPRRAYWHRRLAAALERNRPEDVEALAHHFAAAGQHGQAVTYRRQAARRAEAVYAYEEAAHQLRTALEFGDALDHATRLALLEELADDYRLLRQGGQAVAHYQAALDMWHRLEAAHRGPAVRLYRKILQTAAGMWGRASFAEFQAAAQVSARLRQRLDVVWPVVEAELPHPEAVRLLKALVNDALVVRSPPARDEALMYAQTAVDLAVRLGSPIELSTALATLGTVYGARGMLRQRVQIAEKRLALRRDQRLDDAREHVHMLNGLGSALVHVGEYAQAIPYLLEAEGLAARIRAVDLLSQAHSLLQQCWFRLDRWEEVLKIDAKREELRQQYSLERLGAPCFAIALSATVHGLRGAAERAEALRDESCSIMAAVSGPPERWTRNQHF